MKNLAKRITAFLAAAVMAVSAAGIPVFARAAVPDLQDGWMRFETGDWAYLAPESKHIGIVCNDIYTVDGILYRFDGNGVCKGKYSGMAKKDGILRRYESGLPYTGWTKSSNGSWKYYLDGYSVTGDLQIGNIIYSFDKNGVYTGNGRTAKFSADVVGTVSADTDKFNIKISYNMNDKSEFFACDPEIMERWEKGRWVNCRDAASEFVTDDCLATIKYSKSDAVHFR